jgi:hypothetical protein
MADIKTALTTALLQSRVKEIPDDWEESDSVMIDTKQTKEKAVTTSAATSTLSISESTFNYVKDNPYTTKKAAVIALTQAGYNPASTTSLLSQMVRQKQISYDHLGKMTTLVKKYMPLKAPAKHKPAQKLVMTYTPAFNGVDIDMPKAKDTGGIAALASKPDVAYNIKALLDSINVNEARALYLELKSMFGGN